MAASSPAATPRAPRSGSRHRFVESSKADEKPLAFFHAEADFREPRYFNGDELPGILDGWQTAKNHKTLRKRQSLLSTHRSS